MPETDEQDPFAEGEVEFEFKDSLVEPAGVAEVQCVGMVQSVSKQGNDMIEWTFRLLKYVDAKNAEKGDEFAGKEWIVYTALTEKAQWKVHETLVALGLRTDDDTKKKVRFKRDDALGVVCLAEITHDTYRGQQQSNIDALAPHNKTPGDKREIAAVENPVDNPFDTRADGSPGAPGTDIPF